MSKGKFSWMSWARGEGNPRGFVVPPAETLEGVVGNVPTMQEAVFRAIELRGSLGATDDEVQIVLEARHETVSPRRRELFLLGRVRESGTRRRTRTGRTAKVWVATC